MRVGIGDLRGGIRTGAGRQFVRSERGTCLHEPGGGQHGGRGVGLFGDGTVDKQLGRAGFSGGGLERNDLGQRADVLSGARSRRPGEYGLHSRRFNPAFTTGGDPYTSPVGYFAPNGYGLYDMAGNLYEWCWDWECPYSSGSQTDPRGPPTGSYRAVRGGSWYRYAFFCRTAGRVVYGPSDWLYFTGFRAVLPPGQ
jgi:hypothetical protein